MTVTATAENGESAETTLTSAMGGPLSLHRLFLFDPGYIGVEQHSTEDELSR